MVQQYLVKFVVNILVVAENCKGRFKMIVQPHKNHEYFPPRTLPGAWTVYKTQHFLGEDILLSRANVPHGLFTGGCGHYMHADCWTG